MGPAPGRSAPESSPRGAGPSRDGGTPGRSREAWLGVVAVVSVALSASLVGLRNEFVQDDLFLIVENLRLHSPAHWWTLITSTYWPPPFSEDLYRPLMSLLLAAEHWLGAGGPLLFRVVSYLVYAATAVSVLALARRLLSERIALGVALLFAAHPVHVEAVALGAGQNELLVGLLAATMTVRYLDRRRAAGGVPGPGDWALLGTLFLVASLLKEQGLVLPGLLVAAELCVLPRPGRRLAWRLAGGYVLLAALAIGVLAARAAVLSGDVAGTFVSEALEGQGPAGRALTMLRVVPEWARLLLWPAHLRADYSPQELTASVGFHAPEALGLTLVLGGAATAWLARRRAPTLSFGLAWSAVAFLPISNVLVPTGILLAERTLFLPSIGLVLAVGAVAELFVRTGERRRDAIVRALGVVAAILVVLGVARSAERQRIWRDEMTYVTRSVRDAPASWYLQRAYGQVLFASGNRDEALAAYRRATALVPRAHAWRVRNDLARRLWEVGANDRAVEELQVSLTESPDPAETRYFLVLGYLTLGAYAEAGREATAALARGLSPGVFGELRAVADRALRAAAPPGSLRIQMGTGSRPPWSSAAGR